MVKNIHCLTNSSDSFPDASKEVMLSVISSISNIVSYTTEHMVNRLFLCIKNVIILDGYSNKIYIHNT